MTLKSRLHDLRKRVSYSLNTLVGGSRFIQGELYKALRRYGRRAPAFAGRMPPWQDIIEPAYDYVVLYRMGLTHHILRRIVEAIIQECMRNDGEVVERFKSKCVKCGSEFMKELDVCECGGKMRAPDPLQKPILEAFIKNPNRDDEWRSILASLLRFTLTVDDWYLFVINTKSRINLEPYGYAESIDSEATQVYVEDSRYIRIVADTFGRLGNDQYFCPRCYNGEKSDTYYDLDYFKKHSGKCPLCQGELKQTAYIWREVGANTIKGRFARDEIIHGLMCSQLPHLYGMPKAVAALRPLHILKHMARFNLENYATGKVSKMVFISGMRQQEVNSMVADAKQQAENRVGRSMTTGQTAAPELHTLTVGVDDSNAKVTVVDAMPDPDKMQSLEWYKQHVEDVCAIYSVTPKFEGIAEAGKSGLRMRIDVDNPVAVMYQKSLTDVFDEVLWPKYLGVSDWVWHFNEVEKRDELMDARVKQLNVDTAIKAARAKMNVELEETGELKVSGVPDPPEFMPGEEDDSMEVKVPGERESGVESPWNKAYGENVFKSLQEQTKFMKEHKSWIVTEVNSNRERGKGSKKNPKAKKA